MRCKICGKDKVYNVDTDWQGNRTEEWLCPSELRMRANVEIAEDTDDWSACICEECGSALDFHGDCFNTSCGNSRYQGVDWQ